MLDATRVAKKLWVGAAPPPGDYKELGFDVIVFVADDVQPPSSGYPGVIIRRFPFNDVGNPSREDMETALVAADAVASDLARGRRVLVTCRMGRNRSGFVAALALHFLTGQPGRVTYAVVSTKRRDMLGVHAIANPTFREYLMSLE